jgi:ABC-type phosphate transport system permease subunit
MAESTQTKYMPDEATFKRGLARRNTLGNLGRLLYYIAISIAVLALVSLFLNIINSAFGSIALYEEIDPATLTAEGTPLEELSSEELSLILAERAPGRVPVLLRDNATTLDDPSQFQDVPLQNMLGSYPEEFAGLSLREIRASLTPDEYNTFVAGLLAANMSQPAMVNFVEIEVVNEIILENWPLVDAIFNYDQIVATVEGYRTQEDEAQAEIWGRAELIRYHSWLNREFLTSPMSSIPAQAGIRTAILGSLYVMVLVIIFALPVGIGAAIYLEEYATDNWLNRLIETNVRNLAGVPSIIYGMLGLAVLVRLFAPVTAGQVFGFNLPETTEPMVVQAIAGVVGWDSMPDSAFSILVAEQSASELNRLLTNMTPAQQLQMVSALSPQELESLQRLVPDITLPAPNPDAVQRDTDALTDAQLEELVATFFRYREPRLIDTGLPPRPDLEAAISRTIEPGQLSEAEFDALVLQLEQYARVTINGRTVISAALTLALLILPIIIINGQEALRAVPSLQREASYGLGATRWQTIWRSILPSALPGIMTGTILAVSRAVGETAPLILIGASTYIVTDPSSPFSKFTVLPIQIYQWTARPQTQFRSIAAAAIIVLLILMLTLNAIAIFLRNRYSIRY